MVTHRKEGIAEYDSNPSTLKSEARQRQIQASLGYKTTPGLKNNKQIIINKESMLKYLEIHSFFSDTIYFNSF